MKKAKEEFDKMMKQAKRGKPPTFGQMEKVYATAFMGRFAESLGRNKGSIKELIKRIKMIQVAEENEMDVEEVDPSKIDVGQDEVVLCELELIRSSIETVGSMPPASVLSRYVRYAIKESKWEWLEDMSTLLGTNMKDCMIELIVEGRPEDYWAAEWNISDVFLEEKDIQQAYRMIVDRYSMREASMMIEIVRKSLGTDPKNIKKYKESASKKRYIEYSESMSDDLRVCVETGKLTADVLAEAGTVYSVICDIQSFSPDLEIPPALDRLKDLYCKQGPQFEYAGPCRCGELPILEEACV